MDKRHRDIIHTNLSKLVELTDDDTPILKKLGEKQVFLPDMVEEIQRVRDPAERKQFMYDWITRRGPEAYQKLINTYKELGLLELQGILENNILIAAVRPQIEVTLATRRLDADREECYAMGSRPKGHVLLINNFKFRNNHYYTRHGSQLDVENLIELWEKLGFEVHLKENVSREEFSGELKAFSEMEELTNVDCCVVFVMTHGNVDSSNTRNVFLECSDGLFLSSNLIVEQFSKTKCEAMYRKPKLFFFQSCRGSTPDMYYTDGTGKSKDMRDMIMIYPCSPGAPASRTLLEGTLFVQKLVEVFRLRAHKFDLQTMLDEVAQKMKSSPSREAGVQVLNVEDWHFSRKLYFNPGLYDAD